MWNFNRHFSFGATLSGPSGSVSCGGCGYGEFVTLGLPAVNGFYELSISVGGDLHDGQGASYGMDCISTGGGQFTNAHPIYQGEYWIWNLSKSGIPYSGVIETQFELYMQPPPFPPPPFDFSIELNEHLIYGASYSDITIKTDQNIDELTDKNISFSFLHNDPDVIFYDWTNSAELGNVFTTTLDSHNYYSVRITKTITNYPKHITVIARSNGLQRTDTLLVEAPNKVYAYFERDTLSAGDTVNIIIKKISNPYGWESNYDPGTTFDIGIKNGCGIGMIMDAYGNKSEHFTNIQEPVRFVAANPLTNTDSVIVLNVGAPIVEEGIASLIAHVPADKNQIKNNMSVKSIQPPVKVLNKINAVRSIKSVCNSYAPIYSNNADAQAVVNKKQYVLEIIYPTKDTEEKIDSSPKMPDVFCKARLNGYTGGTVNYEWEYWVSNTLKRNGTNYCDRTSKIEFAGNSDAAGSAITEWKVPFVQPSVKSVDMKSLSQHTCGQGIGSWLYGNDVFTGGDVWVKVTAKNADGLKIAEASVSAKTITGLNPSSSDLLSVAPEREIRAIIYVESRSNQFVNGYPNFGAPNGWGLMQIDNYGLREDPKSATELELWNWRANLLCAKNIFYGEKTRLAKADLKGYSYTPRELLIATISRYNGDNYYIRVDDKWKRKDLKDFNGPVDKKNDKSYADKVIDKYDAI